MNGVVPLAYVEVTCPSRIEAKASSSNNGQKDIAGWTAALIKLQLLQASLRGQLVSDGGSKLMVQWTSERSVAFGHNQKIYSGHLFCQGDNDYDTNKFLLLKHNNPTSLPRRCPCKCRGFAIASWGLQQKTSGTRNCFIPTKNSPVAITQATMVRIILDEEDNARWKSQLTGERFAEPNVSQKEWERMQYSHNPDMLPQLQRYLQRLLHQETWIGTTTDALEWNQQMLQRRRSVQNIIQRQLTASSITTTTPFSVQQETKQCTRGASMLEWDGALLVHSFDLDDGKSRYIEATLQHMLQCHRIHCVRPSALIAKYGVYADAALSMVVHQAVLAAAFRAEPVAIVLDPLDAFVPSKQDTTTVTAETAVWNGMASCLRQLTACLEQKQHYVPFPSSSHAASLYNWNAGHGYVLPVQVCVIGVLTCPADSLFGSKSNRRDQQRVIDALVASRYRLPPLTAQTRLNALRHALQEAGLDLRLSSERFQKEQLPLVAASAMWLRWPYFSRVAQNVKKLCRERNTSVVSLELLQKALSSFGDQSWKGYNVSFASNAASIDDRDIFSMIGGNVDAKTAIQDALAIDDEKRSMLASIGLSPPTGILLYGPPGTGKTLLARAVAVLLRSKCPSSTIGGAFIALNSTDVARAEVGSGEKMVAQAFNTAKKNSPAVVFIDEFQALFGERSGQGGSSRLSSTLLVCMDDLKRWRELNSSASIRSFSNGGDGGDVVVLAATNTPWMIDKSFLRPGRFDRAVHVGLPDVENRTEIFDVHLRRMKLNTNHRKSMSRNLAEATDRFSGADIAALCRAAAVHCLMLNAENVEEDHFVAVLKDGFQPSSDKDLIDMIEKWRPIA